jgi:hypothetical protein
LSCKRPTRLTVTVTQNLRPKNENKGVTTKKSEVLFNMKFLKIGVIVTIDGLKIDFNNKMF